MTKKRVAVLITGDRDAKRHEWAETLMMDFATVVEDADSRLLIQGEARGIDSIGKKVWEQVYGLQSIRSFPAEDFGSWPSCGPRRNRAMLERLKHARNAGWACMVLAYHPDLYGKSKGTRNMAEIAEAEGFEVLHRAQPRESVR